MKRLILTIIFLLSPVIIISAQCDEPTIEKTGKVIISKDFEVKNNRLPDEFILLLKALAQNSSWARKGAESAVLTIFLDGRYNQDLVLFAGAEKFTYRVILGKIPSGSHRITVIFNHARSAGNIGEVKIYSLNIKPLGLNSPAEKMAVSNAPIIYARPDTIDKFSDIPLITYYEILAGGENSYKIRYTTIFTNEDGGTQTAALMARWGRATDIEWVYELEVKNNSIQSEIYQGANHAVKNFAGKRLLGSHPAIFDATVNNNFSDTGCSALRMALVPIPADLSKKSRESVMDKNPWTYRIMAEEMMREGRINAQKLDANTIDDLRNYVYVEVYSENSAGAAVAVEAKTADAKISRSDFDDARLRVDRSGYKRIAVRMPSTNSPLRSITLNCRSLSNNQSPGSCQNSRVVKFIRLGQDYRIFEKRHPDSNPHSLKAGENLVWEVK